VIRSFGRAPANTATREADGLIEAEGIAEKARYIVADLRERLGKKSA
jgi:hypothetical protein